MVSVCPGLSRSLLPVAILWSGAVRETWTCRVLCNGWRCQSETTRWFFLLVSFNLVFALVLNVSQLFNFRFVYFILQEISKQVAGIPLTSMNVQNMDTDYWSDRRDIPKSSVSFAHLVELQMCVYILVFVFVYSCIGHYAGGVLYIRTSTSRDRTVTEKRLKWNF